jgi:hypothetical protein
MTTKRSSAWPVRDDPSAASAIVGPMSRVFGDDAIMG